MVSIGPALHAAAAVLVNSKPWPSPRGLGTMNRRQAAVGLRPVGVGAGQQHEDVGAGGEGAPGLDAVDAQPPPSAWRRDLDAGDVGAEVGLGHGHGDHGLAAGDAGSHSCFCSSVPPFTSARVRISGRVMSDPPTPSDPRDSSSVATTMPR